MRVWIATVEGDSALRQFVSLSVAAFDIVRPADVAGVSNSDRQRRHRLWIIRINRQGGSE